MVTPVSPLLNALRLLQLQVNGPRQAPQRPIGPGAATQAMARMPGSPAGPTAGLLALPARLRALRAREGGLPSAKALRLFIEAALLEELGDPMQLDPAFSDLVERTCLALEQDAGAASLLSRMMVELDALAA